jgi:M6 family metalloprotease-like protein
MRKFVLIAVAVVAFISLFNTPVYSIDLSRGMLFDVPEEEIEWQFGRIPASTLTYEDSIKITSFRATQDTLKVLAILVEWANRPATYSREIFDSLFFSQAIYPSGSISDYFHEVSYGNATVVGDVFGWHEAGFYSTYFDFEAMFAELDSEIDYSQYDGNNDGVVDAVIVLRSGNGKEDSGDNSDIWSYAYHYPLGYGPGPFDGVYLSRWCTAPETMPLRNPIYPPAFSGEDTLNTISVAGHELSHTFGLPDLYDYDDKLLMITYTTPNDNNDHPVVNWCLMGYNGYGLMSIKKMIPPHLHLWCKMQMEWITPIVLDQDEYYDLVIYDIETHADSSGYLIPIDMDNGEYFLLEYRNPHSSGLFDKTDSDFSCWLWPDLTFGADSLDRGLLISHVDDSVAPYWDINEGTPEFAHYGVEVEDAGYNPDRDAYYNSEGFLTDSAQWWYPYETRKAAAFSDDVEYQNEFGPDTYPSSDGYNGPTGIRVLVDSIVDDKLYASVTRDPDLDGVIGAADNCPLVYNPSQEDYDGDLVGDSCDNCIYDYNPSQADGNGNDIGDACDYICGDANDDKDVNVSDAVSIINYVFAGGNPPEPLIAGDVNCDGDVNVSDAVSIINYVFAGGNIPCDPSGDGIPDC